jgi:prepilin-type processing-associated H-X9-DG protein/prepilin-type N-terminal cleavage/methylation domain-containing protein
MSIRSRMTRGFTVVELLVVILIIALLIAILLPALARAREASRTIACANNLRNIGQAVFLYADRSGGAMPSVYSNTFAYIAPFLGEQVTIPTGNDVWRCSSDIFLVNIRDASGAPFPAGTPWNERYQSSYAPNGDRTRGLVNSTTGRHWEAGWSLNVGGVYMGAQWSPFTARYKNGGVNEAQVKISSVANDTIIMAECWRGNDLRPIPPTGAGTGNTFGSQNSLFLNLPGLANFINPQYLPTYQTPAMDPMPSNQPMVARESILLSFYNVPNPSYPSTTPPEPYNCMYCDSTMPRIDGYTGNISHHGTYNSLTSYEGLGTATVPITMDDVYHMGRVNVLQADGHVEAWRSRRIFMGVRIDTYLFGYDKDNLAGTVPSRCFELPWWNRLED